MKDYSYDMLMERLKLDNSLDRVKKVTKQLCDDQDEKRRNLGVQLTRTIPRTKEILDIIEDLEKIMQEISEYDGNYKVKK